MLSGRWFLGLLAGLGIALAAIVAEGGLGAFSNQETVADNTFSSIECIVGGDTGFLNASSDAADTGGDGDGFELASTNAFSDSAGYATNQDGPGDRHRYYDYGISIEQGCSAKGFEVRLDWWLDSTVGVNSIDVKLSWDGGSTWTSGKADATETTSEHTAILGGSTDTWGRSWTVSETSDANFRVRLATLSGQSDRDYFLDWVPVKVYYGP